MLAPGDLRLWKALGQGMLDLKFVASRVLCVEWPESVDAARLPDLGFWNERMGIAGFSSLALGSECDTVCMQARRLGQHASELETLVEESLREAGFKENFEIWEALHYEIQTKIDVEVLEANVLKLLVLESRSGLFDMDSEEMRFVKPGESWTWSRRRTAGDSASALSVEDLLTRLKDANENPDSFEAFLRPYQMREQQPRGPVQTRDAVAFRDRLAAIQKRSDATKIASGSGEGCLPSGVVSALVGFHRYSDPSAVLREVDSNLRKSTAFSDDDLGVVHWLDVGHHRTMPMMISGRKQNFRLGVAPGAQLFALHPLHTRNALLWRRLGALADFHKDIFSDFPWIFSGRETWLAAFRNFIGAHDGWEISENGLRQLFSWEAERTAPQELLLFSSLWNADRVRDTFRDFGFEVVDLGMPSNSNNSLTVKTQKASSVGIAWIDLLQGNPDALPTRPVTLTWTAPDLKTPTYGFEKVSIFPDRYLLRLIQQGSKGALSRRLGFEWRSSARAREVSQRFVFNTPLTALKWSDDGALAGYVDSVGAGAAAASADPKAASVIALEYAFRNLVARGMDPRSDVEASFFLNKPVRSETPEKDTDNFGAYALAVEGFLETLEALPNLKLREVQLDRVSSAIKDYECEPVVHLRGPLSSRSESVFPGFRMTGEAIYAVGPRPAFMDIGSSILQHVRVVSNHVTRMNWTQQLELYEIIHRCIQDKIVTDLRPIMWGGIAECLLEMGLWSGIGIQLKPSLSTIELFSAAPGRFLVGILPQEAKKFESIIKGEWLTPVGTTGGEKLFGLPLESYREERDAKG